jgi:acyl-CoA synthetase (NDP forming)
MKTLIQKTIQEKRNLYEPEAYKLLKDYGLSVVKHAYVPSPQDPLSASKKLPYPQVLKVVSPHILHKSEAGAVKLDICGQKDFKAAYQELRKKFAKKPVAGYLAAQMAEPGIEVVVGMTRDPQFGPALMFGLGGIFVEVFKDVAFRVLPLNQKEARSMIEEIKGYSILAGARGQKPVDLESLAGAILGVAKIAQDHPQILEIDLNPIIAYPKGYKIVDARVILGIPKIEN